MAFERANLNSLLSAGYWNTLNQHLATFATEMEQLWVCPKCKDVVSNTNTIIRYHTHIRSRTKMRSRTWLSTRTKEQTFDSF